MEILESILIHGNTAFVWVATLVGGLIAALVLKLIKNQKTKEIVGRAMGEIGSAVLAVEQTYVNAIKAGRAAGKLTPEERAEAKKQALDVAKSNLGANGVKKLAGVLGVDTDKWMGTKIETVVAMNKKDTAASPKQ